MELKDKAAVITGAGRGIGLAISRRFAAEGAKVVLFQRNAEVLGKVTDELEEAGYRALAVAGDVSRKEDVANLFSKAMEEFGRVDIFVNNAGIYAESSLLEMSDEEWDSVLNVNLRGAFQCLREAGRIMKAQGKGRIVVIASIDGLYCLPNQANYNASKAGLIHLTRSAAVELAPHGIVVNAIAPGWIYTDMTRGELDIQERRRYWEGRIPAGRVGTGEDIAEVALFLAREETGFILGETIVVDGGQTLLS